MRLAAAWERFWFAPQATSSLALVRMATGLIALGWSLSLLPDLFAFFSEQGAVPEPPEGQGPAVWGILNEFPSDAAVVVVYVALVAGSIALTLGLLTRLAALVVFLAMLSFARRNVWVLNSGDGLIRVLTLFLVFAPSGESLSLDRLLRAKKPFWEFPERAPWALRLIQIQLSVLYVSTVWQKVRGVNWNDGTAVSYAQRVEDLERFPLPGFITDGVMISNLLTFGTLAAEFSLGVLIWNRTLRPYVIGLGVALHLGIDYSLRVGFFSFAILACYLAFVPPESAKAFIFGARERIRTFARRRHGPSKVAVPASRMGRTEEGSATRLP